MPDVPITVASGDYDRVRALRDGTVRIAGCAVTYSTVEANALFIRNLKDQGLGAGTTLMEQHPWMARAVLDAFLKAKEIALADLQKLAAFSVTLPWVEAEYRATQAVLGADIWPYGIDENRKAIVTLCRYLHEQGFTQRRMQVVELFAP